MKVKEAIVALSKITDKELLLMVDCPHCGKGNQLGSIRECVLLKSTSERKGGTA